MSPRRLSFVALAAAVIVGAVVIVVTLTTQHSSPRRCVFGAERPQPTRAGPKQRMKLIVNDRGSISGITVGGRSLPMRSNSGGFSVRLAGGTRNVLPNAGFELDEDRNGVPDGWTFQSGTGRPQVTSATARSGRRSIMISIPAEDVSAAFATTVAVAPSTHYVASGWFRSQDVQPTIPPAVREPYHRHSPVQIEAVQISKGRTHVASAHGYTDTAGWNRQFVGFKTGPDVRRIVIRGLIRMGSGTAWFDDLFVGKLLGGPAIPVRGTMTGSQHRREQHSEIQRAGLSLAATFREGSDHVRIDGAVRTSSRRDIALQVAYTLPINAQGWRWGDDARRARRIEGGDYASLTGSSLQRTSVYPFGAVFDPDSTLALGVPLSEPRVFRIEYLSGRGLTVTFDLGLSPAARTGPRAEFSFVVFTADPSWGFRAATAKYYELFPGSFVRRTDPRCEGAWFVAPPLADVDDSYRDFGLGLNMVALGKASSQSYSTWGTRYLGWDDDRGIYTSAYGHHWAFYLPVGTPRSPTPPYDQAVARLRAVADGAPKDEAARRLRDEARAALDSTARDFNGRLYYERYGEFLAHYQNLDTRSSSALDWASAVHRHQVDRALRTAKSAGGRLDGFHVDSTSGMRRWGAADDYDRSHWHRATMPLTFSYDSGLVTLRGIFPLYQHLTRMAGLAHERRMILSANFNADIWRTAGFVGADAIDYFGIEQGLQARANGGTSDPFAMWKRTLAYHRPISTLDARIGKGTLSLDEIDRQLQQNLFYGIFAGAWNPKVEAEATGEETKWTDERFAEIWARYTPVFKKLARAGWEPVTNARSSDPAVWVERFGSRRRGLFLFTVRNETGASRPYRLSIDLAALAGGPFRTASARDEVTGRPISIAIDRAGTRGVISDVIPPVSTRVIAVALPP